MLNTTTELVKPALAKKQSVNRYGFVIQEEDRDNFDNISIASTA
jgi:hypothetical protein